MRHFLLHVAGVRSLVSVSLVVFGLTAELYGQARDFAAQRLVLDDNTGGTITLQTPGSIGGNLIFTVPSVPTGASFILNNSLSGQTISGGLTINGGLNVNGGLNLGATILDPANGGTGISSYSVGDLLYASGTTTLSPLAVGIAGQFLGVSGGLPVWTNDGSGITSLNATNIASGTLADGRLSSNVPLKDAANTFTLSNSFNGGATLGNGDDNVTINAGTGTFSVSSGRITSVADPTGAQDAATKNYVDNTALGGFSGPFVQLAPGTIQAVSSANPLVNLNQTGAGSLLRLQSSGSNEFVVANNGDVTIGGAVSATSFSGDGSALTNLNASNLSSGDVPQARMQTNVVGAINATANIINDANLSSNIARLNGANTWTGASNTFNNGLSAGSSPITNVATPTAATDAVNKDYVDNTALGGVVGPFVQIGPSSAQGYSQSPSIIWVNENGGSAPNLIEMEVGGADQFVVDNGGDVTATSFTGDGTNLTNLNASNITSGTLDDARLSSNVPLLDANNTWTGTNTFNNTITGTVAGNSIGSVADAVQLTVNGPGNTATANTLDVNGNIHAAGAITSGASIVINGFAATRTITSDAATNITTGGALGISTTAGDVTIAPFGGTTNVTGALSVSNGVTLTGGSFTGDASGLTSIPASQLTGALPAIDGSAITNLNASNLTSGDVPQARMEANVIGAINAASGTIDDARVTDALTISGGTIDNTPIGSTTPSTGAFTTITGTSLPSSSTATDVVVSNAGALETRTIASLGGSVAVSTDATLTGDGTTGTPLGLDLTNANAWTGTQTLPTTAAQGDALIASTNAGTTTIDATRIGAGLTDAQVSNNLTISGGTVDASPIGATTPSTGAFTTIAGGSSLTLGDDATPTPGTVVLHDNTSANTFTGTVQTATALTASRTYTLPDATGTLALTSDIVVNHDATLTGNGTVGTPLGFNLTNANTWTGTQTLPVTAAQGDALIASTNAGTTTIDATRIGAGLTDAQVNDNLTISGGTVDATPIGATTRAAGNFTALDANGAVTLGDGNDNVSVNAGSGTFAITSSGLTVTTGGNVTVGGLMQFSYGTVAAGASVTIPAGVTVAEVTDDGGSTAMTATMPTVAASDNGRVLYIANNDAADALGGVPGGPIPVGQTWEFIVIAGAWARVQ